MMESESRDKTFVPLPATNGPRPHRCEICQRSFREIATLRKHEQLHRADRPYTCQTCGKSFLWSSNLKVHERVHTGERPYKCKICHRCFTQSNDLRRHERNVHMRGKLYSYKAPSGRPLPPPAPNPNHMSLAAYQAFALQQRAILQHALTYESLMQNAAGVSGSHFMNQMAGMQGKDGDVSTSTTTSERKNQDNQGEEKLPRKGEQPLKLEQVTPPPLDQEDFERSDRGLEENGQHSPGQSGYSPRSNKTQSPPALSSTTYGQTNGHRSAAESPVGHKDERPASHESHFNYSKYYSSFSVSQSRAMDLQTHYQSAFSAGQNSAIDSVMDLSMNKSLSSLESG